MEDDIAKITAERDEYLEGWKRAKADYANLKRDSERMQGELAKYAAASLIAELLPVLDGFKKADGHRPSAADPKAVEQWMEGIGHVRTQLEALLGRAGIAPIEEEGIPFDPSRHEAMLAEKREGAPPGTVIKILEPGYTLHEKVLRPAKVIVAE